MINFFLFISILFLYFIVYFDLKKNQIIYNVSYSENNKHHIKKNIQTHKKIPDISINKTTNFKDSNIIKTDKQTDNFKNEVKVENEEEDDSSERLRYKLMNRDYQVVDNPLSAPERRVEEQQYSAHFAGSTQLTQRQSTDYRSASLKRLGLLCRSGRQVVLLRRRLGLGN